MSIELIALIGTGVLGVLLIIGLVYRYMPKRLKHDSFVKNWKDLQASCRSKQTWPDALISADRLLDKALKRRRIKGKTMGERMVSAQRMFMNNDEVWYAHNLTKKLITKPDVKLRESDVKLALVGFRQALRDLGALPSDSKNQQIAGSEDVQR